jgi:hypothetical protein
MPRHAKRAGRRGERQCPGCQASGGDAHHRQCAYRTSIESEAEGARAVDPVVGLTDADNPMNNVEVNPPALEAEALAALNGVTAPTVDGQQPEEELTPASPEEIRQGYEVLFTGLVGWSAQVFAPNWAITPDETTGMSKALTGACVLWFPDQPIPAKYLAILVVAASAAQIVQARQDPETGTLKPLRATQSEKPATNEAA